MDNLKTIHSTLKLCALCGVRKMPGSKNFLTRFPLDPDRCRLWIKAVGIEDYAHIPIEMLQASYFLCGSHFEPKYLNKNGNELLKTAIPTINLIYPPLMDSLLEFPYPTMKSGKTEQTRELQEVTNLSEGAVQNVVIESAVEHNYIPLPSTSKAPHEMSYEKVLPEELQDVTNLSEGKAQNVVIESK